MQELKGQAKQGAERREAIVDAALEVFAQRGYRSGALTEIAEKVDLTPAGILYHFGSKEALLLAVIAERDRRAGEIFAEFPEHAGLASLRDVVRFAELSEREPGLTALHAVLHVESIDAESPTHAYFQERSRFTRGLVEQTLRDAQAAARCVRTSTAKRRQRSSSRSWRRRRGDVAAGSFDIARRAIRGLHRRVHRRRCAVV